MELAQPFKTTINDTKAPIIEKKSSKKSSG